jgi:MerR family redox-sensitive transcriptional activator SoxR
MRFEKGNDMATATVVKKRITASQALRKQSSEPTMPAPGRDATGLTVLDVVRESGVSASAIRFYEKHGLIKATRTRGNQRRFGSDAGCRVKIARVAQRVGLTISQITELFDNLPADASFEQWQQVHTSLVEEAERRIAAIRNDLEAITSGRKLCEL